MKVLIVVRHAKAAWKEPGDKDELRVLEEQGVLDAEKLGQILSQERIIPGIVLASSAVRASKTASIIVENLGLTGSIIRRKENLYNASAETILEVIRDIEPTVNVAMVVAHNPGISDFVGLVTDGSPVSMGACDAAIVGFEIDRWESCLPGSGFLSRYIENY